MIKKMTTISIKIFPISDCVMNVDIVKVHLKVVNRAVLIKLHTILQKLYKNDEFVKYISTNTALVNNFERLGRLRDRTSDRDIFTDTNDLRSHLIGICREWSIHNNSIEPVTMTSKKTYIDIIRPTATVEEEFALSADVLHAYPSTIAYTSIGFMGDHGITGENNICKQFEAKTLELKNKLNILKQTCKTNTDMCVTAVNDLQP